MGKKLREKCPRESHAIWQRPRSRPNPLHFLEESNKGRIRALIPIRYGRMMQSPFTFYRGTALNMAADKAIADFSIAYADQSERDRETLTEAVRAGKVEAFIEDA
jgi:hypothetical protein